MRDLVTKTDKKILALWAIECAERVMHFFEEKYPQDHRPRAALKTLEMWIATGDFQMSIVRKASLDSHAAARDVGEESPARSAAHAAGQAVATAHVATHAYGPAIYAQQAIHRVSSVEDADMAVTRERDWQYKRLCKLREQAYPICLPEQKKK
jgi:hypothetical protein